MSRKKFEVENRTRFNWGYHDARRVVREGWQDKNFGFGDTIKIKTPEDVLAKHHDPLYARGWMYGYYDSTDHGMREQTSEHAWVAALRAGQVTK